jgi:hypothetical protein
VQVLNRIVLNQAPLAIIAALLLVVMPSVTRPAHAADQKPPSATEAQTARQPAAASVPRAAYASADLACTTGRKRLWTEAGWMVRRVTSCR